MAQSNMSQYKYTPASTSGMSAGQMRRAYSYLRGVVNKRADRIAKKGFGSYEYGKRLPKLSEIPDSQIRAALLDASRRARDIESFSGGFEERLQDRIDKLHQAGFEGVTRSNVQDFFNFMDRREEAFKRGLYDSNIVARLYSMASSRGVTPRVIERQFSEYMSSNSGMERLYDAIESFDLPEHRKRMSSTEIRQRLE